MVNLIDKLEQIASRCSSVEEYIKYLFNILDHLKVVRTIVDYCINIKELEDLAKIYIKVLTDNEKDKIMYEIIYLVIYYSIQDKQSSITSINNTYFIVMNADIIVTKELETMKLKQKAFKLC